MGKIIRVVTGKKTDVCGVRKDRIVVGRTTREMTQAHPVLHLLGRVLRAVAGPAPFSWCEAMPALAQATASGRSSSERQRARAYGRLNRPGCRLRPYRPQA